MASPKIKEIPKFSDEKIDGLTSAQLETYAARLKWEWPHSQYRTATPPSTRLNGGRNYPNFFANKRMNSRAQFLKTRLKMSKNQAWRYEGGKIPEALKPKPAPYVRPPIKVKETKQIVTDIYGIRKNDPTIRFWNRPENSLVMQVIKSGSNGVTGACKSKEVYKRDEFIAALEFAVANPNWTNPDDVKINGVDIPDIKAFKVVAKPSVKIELRSHNHEIITISSQPDYTIINYGPSLVFGEDAGRGWHLDHSDVAILIQNMKANPEEEVVVNDDDE